MRRAAFIVEVLASEVMHLINGIYCGRMSTAIIIMENIVKIKMKMFPIK